MNNIHRFFGTIFWFIVPLTSASYSIVCVRLCVCIYTSIYLQDTKYQVQVTLSQGVIAGSDFRKDIECVRDDSTITVQAGVTVSLVSFPKTSAQDRHILCPTIAIISGSS